jgi:hypothetical protein
MVEEQARLRKEIVKMKVFLENLRSGTLSLAIKDTNYTPKHFGDGIRVIAAPRPLEVRLRMYFAGEPEVYGAVCVTDLDLPNLEDFALELAESMDKKMQRRYQEITEKIAAVETLLNGPE